MRLSTEWSAARIISISLVLGCTLAAVIFVPLTTFGHWVRSQPQTSVLLLGPSMWPAINTFDVVTLASVDSVDRGVIISYRFGYGRSVHRVIGLPTETVTVQDGSITVTRGTVTQLLDEPYVQTARASSTSITKALGPDEYLVIGDNRLWSQGLDVVPKTNIEGVVAKIIFPPWRVSCLRDPC
ncbi:MAG: Signal peptidase I S [Nitrospira sp.]|nr:Signal peptidase I S [Nitrospira sp.]